MSARIAAANWEKEDKWMEQVTRRRAKRIFAWLMTLIIIAGSVSLPGNVARAAGTQPSGAGTEGDPYKIGTVEELIWFRNEVNVNGKTTACAVLTSDITITEDSVYYNADQDTNALNLGIGQTESKPYIGSFDGAGYTINGVSSSQKQQNARGFFNFVGSSGVVKNLTIKNIKIEFSNSNGAWDPIFGGIAGKNYGRIENCHNIGGIVRSFGGSAIGYAGGICGINEEGGVIQNCTNTATTVGSFQGDFIGGIAGGNNGIVKYCYNTGAIEGIRSIGGVGGIAGENNGNVEYCYNSGNLARADDSDDYYYIGGIVGRNSLVKLGTITGCFNYGTSNCEWGGIVKEDKKEGGVIRCCYDEEKTGAWQVGYPSWSGAYGYEYPDSKALTTVEFSSGKAAYLMNGEKSDNTQAYYQTLGTDAYPVLDKTHGTVYQAGGIKYCDGSTSEDAGYSNTNGGASGTVVHTKLASVAGKAATCTQPGNQAYYKCSGCNKCYSDAAGTQEVTEAEMQISKTGHKMDAVPEKTATCTESGNRAYWSCKNCGQIFADASGNTATTPDAVTIKATGHTYTEFVDDGNGTTHTKSCSKCGEGKVTQAHTWGPASCETAATCTVCGAKNGSALGHTYGNPQFTWIASGEGYTVTAVFVCTSCSASESKACTVTSDMKAAECTKDGSKTYTAKVVAGSKEHTDTKVDIIKATGHNMEHKSAVKAGCETKGCKEHWECKNCGKLYLDDSGRNETTKESLVIAAMGHDNTEYIANDDGNTHSVRCKNCKKVKATEEHMGGTASCHTKARCQKCNAEYGGFAEHKYGQPEFDWKRIENSYAVTAVFTCKNTGCTDAAAGHSKRESCTVESLITKKASCTGEGSIVYTARFGNYSDSKNEVIPAAGHKLSHVDAKEPGECEGDGNREYWTCSECKQHFLDSAGTNAVTLEEVILKAPGHNYQNVTDNGDGTHSAACERCGNKFDREEHRGGTATCVEKAHCIVCQAEYGDYGSHRYGEPQFVWKENHDGYDVVAVFTCTNAGCPNDKEGHRKELPCTVTGIVTKVATCTEKGSKIYKAEITEGDRSYEDSRNVDLEALGHSLQQITAKDATCTESGNREYWMCSECNNLFANASGTEETTVEKITIAALGHSFETAVDNGDGTHSASCERCGNVFDSEAHRGGTPSCYEKAKCDVCGGEYGSLIPHHYGIPVFDWKQTEGGYEVKAAITCTNIGCTNEAEDHIIERICTVEGPIVTEATNEKEGSRVYTAKVMLNGQQYTDTKTEVIPVKEPEKKPDEGGSGGNSGGENPPQGPIEYPEPVLTPAVGTRITDESTKAVYQVTQSSETGGTVTYVKANKAAAKADVPAVVTIAGKAYKVTAIAKNAFANNKKIKTVTIGKNVTMIGDKAFYKCTKLSKITIPAGVKKIGKQAFSGCKNLKSITIKTTKLTNKTVGSKAFKGIHKKAVIKVPKKKLAAYKKLLKSKGVGSKAKIKK